MKFNILICMLFSFQNISFSQATYEGTIGHIVVGMNLEMVQEQNFGAWSEDYENSFSLGGYEADLEMPKMILGPSIGWGIYNGHFYSVISYVWSQRSFKNSFTDDVGVNELRKFKLKYHHVEGSLFYFPKAWVIGIGGAIDVGFHAFTERDKRENGLGYRFNGVQHLRQFQVGCKLGLSVMVYRSKNLNIRAAPFYQLGFLTGKMSSTLTDYSISPTHFGLRVDFGLFPHF